MIPILTDNARMLASAYRNLSAAQKESRTEVVQQGVTLTLSSWKDGRIYRNSLVVSYRDDIHHDRYDIELRDLVALTVVDDMLIIQTEFGELVLDTVEEFVPAPWPYSACVHPDPLPPQPPRRRERRHDYRPEPPPEPFDPHRPPAWDPHRPEPPAWDPHSPEPPAWDPHRPPEPEKRPDERPPYPF